VRRSGQVQPVPVVDHVFHQVEEELDDKFRLIRVRPPPRVPTRTGRPRPLSHGAAHGGRAAERRDETIDRRVSGCMIVLGIGHDCSGRCDPQALAAAQADGSNEKLAGRKPE
jgi:hypothetical protein